MNQEPVSAKAVVTFTRGNKITEEVKSGHSGLLCMADDTGIDVSAFGSDAEILRILQYLDEVKRMAAERLVSKNHKDRQPL